MLRVGLEPTIPVFERTKAVHALDRAATVFDHFIHYHAINLRYVVRCYRQRH
jgi:hypothetical protein